MKASRNLLALIVSAAQLLSPSQVWAQSSSETNGNYSFIGVREGWNSRIGQSFDLGFKVDKMPSGGLVGEAGIADIIKLCKAVATAELDRYLRANRKDPPKYYAITVQLGGNFNLYGRLYFRGVGDCVPVKLSSLK